MENSIEQDIEYLERIDIKYFLSRRIGQSNYIVSKADEVNKAIEHILSDYKKVLKSLENTAVDLANSEKENEQLRTEVNSLKKENEELKEYIVIAPNLDKMTAIKYRNIQRDAYIHGRAEEKKRAEQIIYENFIPVQKIKDKIEELKKKVEELTDEQGYWGGSDLLEQIKVLQELVGERK